MRNSNRRTAAFLPGAVGRHNNDGAGRGPWVITYGHADNDGSVSIERRTGHVPASMTPLGRAVRVHEALHARHSPSNGGPKELAAKAYDRPDLHRLAYAAEEYRVNVIGLNGGLAPQLAPILDALPAARFALALEDPIEQATLLTQRSLFAPGERLPSGVHPLAKGLRDALRATSPRLGPVQYTREVFSYLEQRGLLPPRPTPPPPLGAEEPDRDTDGLPGKVPPPETTGVGGLATRKPTSTISRDTLWGNVEVLVANLTERTQSPEGMRRIYSRSGRRIAGSRLIKFAQGGRAFRKRRHVPQRGDAIGCILIDASGSMHWSPEQLVALTAAAPYATVAVYSGHDVTGTIRVYAHGGRRASAATIAAVEDAGNFGGNNTIDGPALRWARQAARGRETLWVSDGRATAPSPGIISPKAECAAYIAKHGITRIEKDDALDRFGVTK
jgi:hypothetical protein